METQNLKESLRVFYIEASSFPNGVKGAHEKLHSLVHSNKNRRFFGISWGGSDGNIIYKAAAEELYEGEGEKYGCETFTIEKGNYISDTLHDWQRDESQIGRKFREMLKDPRVDKNGYCVEEYASDKDLICMVKLND